MSNHFENEISIFYTNYILVNGHINYMKCLIICVGSKNAHIKWIYRLQNTIYMYEYALVEPR